MSDLIPLLLIVLVGVAFIVGHSVGMKDMARIDMEYGADHTRAEKCWCRRFQWQCEVAPSNGATDE